MRIPASALTFLVSMGFTAAFGQQAQVSGRVTNGNGRPVPSAVVVLCNEDANLWFMTSSGGDGAFDLAGLPPGEFSIEVLAPVWRRPNTGQAWGFRPWTDSVSVRAGQNARRDIQLGNDARQPWAAKTPPPCTPARPFSMVDRERLAGLLLEGTAPTRPPGAASPNGEAHLTLEAFLNKEGRVISLRLLASSWPPGTDPALMRAAVEAVRNWRYRPPENGHSEVFEFLGEIAVDFSSSR